MEKGFMRVFASKQEMTLEVEHLDGGDLTILMGRVIIQLSKKIGVEASLLAKTVLLALPLSFFELFSITLNEIT